MGCGRWEGGWHETLWRPGSVSMSFECTAFDNLPRRQATWLEYYALRKVANRRSSNSNMLFSRNIQSPNKNLTKKRLTQLSMRRASRIHTISKQAFNAPDSPKRARDFCQEGVWCLNEPLTQETLSNERIVMGVERLAFGVYRAALIVEPFAVHSLNKSLTYSLN